MSSHMPVIAELMLELRPPSDRGTSNGLLPWWWFIEVTQWFVMLLQLDLKVIICTIIRMGSLDGIRILGR